MTDYYIDSNAAGANNGTSWTDAWNAGTQADWASAIAAATVAGDRIFVAHNNATVCSADLALTVNANHTKDNPLQIIVANSSTSAPVSNYGASGNGEIDGNSSWDVTWYGNFYIYGLRIQNHDSGSIDGAGASPVYERCYYNANKSLTGEVYSYSNGGEVTFIDCDINLANNDHSFTMWNDACGFRMIGGSITTDANVTEIFTVTSTKSGFIELIGVDLTGINAATDLCSGAASEKLIVRADNCNWPATMPALWGGSSSDLTDLSSIIVTGDQNEASGYTRYGTFLQETTIYRSGGATDGTNEYSLKIESNSVASRASPFRHLIAIDNPGDLDTLTIKVHFAQNSGAALTNEDIWIECLTPTSASVSSDTNRTDLSASGSTLTDESGNVDWRNGVSALASYSEQSCSVTVSGATTGLLYVVLCVAADFATTNNLYVDPYPVIA